MSRLRRELPAVLVLVAVAVAHAAILLLAHRTFFALPDNVYQFWAWYQKAAISLHTGGFPLWDQNTLAGHSFVGETQTGVFYPLNLIWLLVLGGAHGITARRLDVLVELHFLIASLGFYALARSFRVGRIASLIAAIVFAYTGIVFFRAGGQTAIFYGLTWVPWTLFFAHRQIETGRLRFAFAAGATIALGVLAGHFQPPFHAALMLVLLYALATPVASGGWRDEWRPRATALVSTFAAAAILALPQLVYSIPYLGRAYRFIGPVAPIPPGGSIGYKVFSHLYAGGPDSALTLINPQAYAVADGNTLFIGLGALAVLIVAVVLFRGAIRRQAGRYHWALVAIAFVGAAAMLGPWTPFPALLYVLPLVSEVRELSRYSIMVHVSLCLLLAFALQALGAAWPRAGERRWSRSELVVLALGVLLAADALYTFAYPPPNSTNWYSVQLLLAAGVLLVLGGARWIGQQRFARRLPLLGLLAIPLVAASVETQQLLHGSSANPLYPARYYARTPEITFAERACAPHRIAVLHNALPANLGDVFPSLRIENGRGATMHAPFYDFITSFAWSDPVHTRLLDERCIASTTPISEPGYRLGFRNPADGVSIYVNDNTSPLNTPALVPVPVRVLAQEDRKLAYAVTLPRATTVVFSAIVYPGWNLRVDGRSVPTTSYRVRGVPVFPEVTIPAGSHLVQYSWSGWPS